MSSQAFLFVIPNAARDLGFACAGTNAVLAVLVLGNSSSPQPLRILVRSVEMMRDLVLLELPFFRRLLRLRQNR